MGELTPAQQRVARLVAQGLTNKAISRATGLSISTVRQHVVNAAARLPGETKPRHRITLWVLKTQA